MYLDHWGIDLSPFRGGMDLDRFFASPVHEEALARIDFLVNARRRVGLLVGDSGVGKSLTLRAAQRELGRAGAEVAFVDVLGIQTREFFWQIADQFGTTPRAEDDMGRLWRRITNRIAENRLQGVESVLLLDDAGQAGPDLLTQFVRLARIDQTPDSRWTVVLAAQPGQFGRWHELLRELLDLRINLGPWSEADTVGFLQSALVDAGRLQPAFDDEALATLHELSGGVPRQVLRLADFALLAGAAAKLERIDAETVQSVREQVAWTMASAAVL